MTIHPRNILTSRAPLRLSLLVLLAATTLSACATKSDRRGPPPERDGSQRQARTSGTFLQPISVLFTGMDISKDTVLSRAELTEGIEETWSSFSRNPSAVAFSQWSVKNLGSTDARPTFMDFDRDFNGVVTESEFSKQLTMEFDRLDKNKDGRVERSEMVVAFAAPQGQRKKKENAGGKPKRGQGGGGGRPPR